MQIPDGDPRVSSSRCMEFTRSSAACGSGATSVFFDRVQTREQVNQLTAYIDASQVYGSDPDLASHLRNLTAGDLGRLREGPSFGYGKPLLPFNNGLPVDCRRHGCQMAIARFLDCLCLALWASGLWLRFATLQNLIPSFPWIAPGWRV